MKPDKIDGLEAYYASDTLKGLISSGYSLLRARRLNEPGEEPGWHISEIPGMLLYTALIVMPAIILEAYHKVRYALTSEPRGHPQGAWQWALHFSLREDPAHHTVETVGYHESRPEKAEEVDDLAAWVMTLIQFLWSYEELMGVVWDEWTMVRLVAEASHQAGLSHDEQFYKLTRQWELARPYNAPLNGTYADVRRSAFTAFITPRIEALPDAIQHQVEQQYDMLSQTERRAYQEQMSLLRRIVPGAFRDDKEVIPLWDATISVVLDGIYYFIPVCVRDDDGHPVIFGEGDQRYQLLVKDGTPYTSTGVEIYVVEDQCYRVRDDVRIGYLDMAPFSVVKAQVEQLLAHRSTYENTYDDVDVLLAETPRRTQARLRRQLPKRTQEQLDRLADVPIILNWDERPSGNMSLAQLRRVQRGIGDHALTVIRTDRSFLFDQHHIFFDGVWSLAMAEVLTNSAVQWCVRGLSITSGEATPNAPLDLHATRQFLEQARSLQGLPEISAETTIHDISNLLSLRGRLRDVGASLTVNDLLVTARIFHAVQYRPTPKVKQALDAFRNSLRTADEQQALEAVEESLRRGRRISPTLSIPVDASPSDPRQRVYLLTFRNVLEDVVWTWDSAWSNYQDYRRIEPPTTPEGHAAYDAFDTERHELITALRDFSYLLAASKQVAVRGDSFSVAVFNLLSHMPAWMQYMLRLIPEQFDVLNEIIRGDEVYSNIGRVAAGSSLSRFITAKDDGKAKSLVWGIMTDDSGNMVVTMRDFRPHVEPLVKVGRVDLAHLLAQDYVETYTNVLFGLVARLTAMLMVSPPRTYEAAPLTTELQE